MALYWRQVFVNLRSMDAMEDLPLFLAVAEERSFTAAGERFGLSRSAAGKAVARLEARLGIVLFKRTTRQVRLTDAGEILLERARVILATWEATEAALAATRREPRGRLRLALPAIGHRLVGPHLRDFLARYPGLSIDLDQDDRFLDLMTAGVDVAIRSGRLDDATHRSRHLADFRFLLCAAPGYLDVHGIPARVSDAGRHAQIRFRFPGSERLQSWRLNGGEEPTSATPAFVSTSMEGVLAATRAGIGIAQLPDFLAAEDIAAGRLTVILADTGPTDQFWLVWLQHLHRTPKVRALVEHLVSGFSRAKIAAGRLD